jgi:DNA-binding transcriptional LysR family regulator
MARFDLELLLVFDEIYKTRNVTRAAGNLGLPQSTVSIGLAKLREHFNDRLFSRTAKGMEPTPRAENAIADVRRSIQALQHALAEQPVFDPANSQREFRICMTDISEVVLLPQLLNHLRKVGTGIRLDVSKISPDSPAELADGTVDLAVGFMPHLEAGFYQQTLFNQHFTCLVSADHPRIGKTTLRLDALQREAHVVVRTSGTGHAIVDKVLAQEAVQRKVALQLPSFLGVARIVAETEMIAIVPHRYGAVMAGREHIRMLPVPVKLPSFSVKQHWHERYHADASNRWLRQVMAQLFSERKGKTDA